MFILFVLLFVLFCFRCNVGSPGEVKSLSPSEEPSIAASQPLSTTEARLARLADMLTPTQSSSRTTRDQTPLSNYQSQALCAELDLDEDTLAIVSEYDQRLFVFLEIIYNLILCFFEFRY